MPLIVAYRRLLAFFAAVVAVYRRLLVFFAAVVAVYRRLLAFFAVVVCRVLTAMRQFSNIQLYFSLLFVIIRNFL